MTPKSNGSVDWAPRFDRDLPVARVQDKHRIQLVTPKLQEPAQNGRDVIVGVKENGLEVVARHLWLRPHVKPQGTHRINVRAPIGKVHSNHVIQPIELTFFVSFRCFCLCCIN